MGIEKTIAKQNMLREEFLAKELPESQQSEIVEVYIHDENNCLNSSNVPEGLERRTLVVPDLQTLKNVAGSPDMLYEEGVIGWEQQITGLEDNLEWKSFKELNNGAQTLVCKILNQYIYGNSTKVNQYENMLSRLCFPMEIDYFGNENTDIIVEAGQSMLVGDTNKQVALKCRRLVLKEHARLICVGNVDLCAEQIEQTGEASPEANFQSVGSAGGNGGNGGIGGDGSNGEVTQAGSSGGAGGNGVAGAAGGNANIVVARIKDIPEGNIAVCSVGGNGGNGGNGGRGGNGGNGGDGVDEKGRNNGGAGGNGGKGGDGGAGGDAGNGNKIEIYCNYPDKIKTLQKFATGGNGGSGGNGGAAGKGGKGKGGSSGSTGTAGAGGAAGAAGKSGTSGTVTILPYVEE